MFASEGEYSPQALQVTGTAAELLAFAAGIRDAVHLVEMRQLAESMDPIPGRSRRERLPPQDRQGDGAAWGGFRWTLDEGAEVIAPDWDPTLCAAADSTAF